MYQQVMLIGNLGGAPEMRYTPSGVSVASFRLAVNKRWTDNEGKPQEKTTWFNITTWRGQAEIVSRYLSKGSKVLVIGEVDEARPWVDRDGNQRASVEITANEVRFLDGRPPERGNSNGVAQNGKSRNGANGTAAIKEEAAVSEAVLDIPL